MKQILVNEELLREARDNCKASIAESGISTHRKEYRAELEARLTEVLEQSAQEPDPCATEPTTAPIPKAIRLARTLRGPKRSLFDRVVAVELRRLFLENEALKKSQQLAIEPIPSTESKSFNYCIGYPSRGGAIGTYTMHSTDVFHGDLEDAEGQLRYVKTKAPDKDWKIYALTEYTRSDYAKT